MCGVGGLMFVACCWGGNAPIVAWCVVGLRCWCPCMCVPEGMLPLCGLVVLVCWWCVAWALPLVVWRVGDVVCWCPRMCVHEGAVAPLWFGGVGVLVV